MSRLTNKYDGVKEYYFKTYTPYCDCYKDEANKLGQLEDIEEQIGIDLATKDRVERSTYCYWKDKNNELYEFVINKSERIGVLIEDYDGYRCLLLYKDYGKTWALTKEELENE